MGDRVRVEVEEPFVDRETGGRRAAGDTYETSLERAEALHPLVRIVGPDGHPAADGFEWGGTLTGRWLETADVESPGPWSAVVGCLNVWNDLQALEKTMPTWYPHVDRVVAVDGAYTGAPADVCASTDGTVEFLRSLDKVDLVAAPANGFWPDQAAKRNEYFRLLGDDELGFVVDADEFVRGAEFLPHLPDMDVGWAVYRKRIYRKAQSFPRLFAGRIRPRYRGRHYWVYSGDVRVTDCQTGAPGYDHAFVPVEVDNRYGRDLRSESRRSDRTVVMAAQQQREAEAGPEQQGGRESLRVVQLTSLDPGMVVFRLHSAINATSPHESAMASTDHGRVYEDPHQYDVREDRGKLRRALRECDVIHCHLSYQELDRLGVRYTAPVVVHHHGTMYRRSPEKRVRQDDRRPAALRLVSNPELLRYNDGYSYLPNPVPVARYRKMRGRLWAPDPDRYFRIGHSPSKRELKGTDDFLAAVERVRASGVRVRPVLIEGATHAESLRLKAAECDAFFDSFWLGMQCSGLEAAAMGVPVIAGDDHVAAWHGGEDRTPYVFADNGDQLAHAIRELAGNEYAWARAADRAESYVIEHHDYAAVVRRYLDLLDEATDWRRRLTLGREKFLSAR